MQPVAPPSPDYIPGLGDPHTPPVPQDEDEREAMFIQPHDPDYVPEPIYPEYIPLEDEHVFPVEEQPLPPVDSPTAKSPGYVTKSDPEEDPEEYKDDKIEDGQVDYPIDGGDDGDDDNGDSSRDDTDEEEEEEEHPAPTDSAVVVPTVEPVSPPEGTEHVIPPPSTDISTTGARITGLPTPYNHHVLPLELRINCPASGAFPHSLTPESKVESLSRLAGATDRPTLLFLTHPSKCPSPFLPHLGSTEPNPDTIKDGLPRFKDILVCPRVGEEGGRDAQDVSGSIMRLQEPTVISGTQRDHVYATRPNPTHQGTDYSYNSTLIQTQASWYRDSLSDIADF
ncbi:hypothetical protein Tco_1084517 [Tanacetum coccineum]